MKPVTRALHAFARLALELRSPLQTKRLVNAVGRLLPPLDADGARRELQSLERAGRGTCLSRSLSIAARLPGSYVMIGVARPEVGGTSERGFAAHAWVEWEGAPIREEPLETAPVARL